MTRVLPVRNGSAAFTTGGLEGGGDVRERAEQGERLIVRRHEAASSPEGGGLLVERVHDRRPAEVHRRARPPYGTRLLPTDRLSLL
jgi:hypothetical protein